MTIDYKIDMMSDLRKHLWSGLTSANIFNEEDYYSENLNANIVPILPVQQQPELDQFLSGKKHIIYDKIGMSYEENWVICCEQILLTIYATDYSEIAEIRNFITDQYRRMDESAADTNRFSGISNKFKFYSIFIADISETSPSEELAGFFSSDIVLEVKYSRHVGTDGRFL
jgi:hypothetical protein